MAIKLQSSSGGSVKLDVPITATNYNVTIPAATGTAMVSGNMPAFSAYATGGQTVATSTYTKLQFNALEFDTANCYDPTTNYRFTPNVAGYYQVNVQISNNTGTSTGYQLLFVYKNGSQSTYFNFVEVPWKISGPLYDVKENDILMQGGVIDSNLRSIQQANKTIPGIDLYLTNLTLYYKP